MRNQSNEIKNRVNRASLHCVWTRSDRTPGAPLMLRWVCDQPQTPNDREGVSDRKNQPSDAQELEPRLVEIICVGVE
jgi:hypothetical protein